MPEWVNAAISNLSSEIAGSGGSSVGISEAFHRVKSGKAGMGLPPRDSSENSLCVRLDMADGGWDITKMRGDERRWVRIEKQCGDVVI